MKSQPVAGVVFSCLLSVVAVVVLASTSEDMIRSALFWVIFVTACGLAIDVPPAVRPLDVFRYALFPGCSLLVSAALLCTLAAIMVYQMVGEYEVPWQELALLLLVAVVTIPGTMAAIYGASRVVGYADRSRGSDIKGADTFQTKTRIIGLVALMSLLVVLFHAELYEILDMILGIIETIQEGAE